MNDEKETFVIVCLGHAAICPVCAGLMHMIMPDQFMCVDCKSRFIYDDAGIADREITIKRLEGLHESGNRN